MRDFKVKWIIPFIKLLILLVTIPLILYVSGKHSSELKTVYNIIVLSDIDRNSMQNRSLIFYSLSIQPGKPVNKRIVNSIVFQHEYRDGFPLKIFCKKIKNPQTGVTTDKNYLLSKSFSSKVNLYGINTGKKQIELFELITNSEFLRYPEISDVSPEGNEILINDGIFFLPDGTEKADYYQASNKSVVGKTKDDKHTLPIKAVFTDTGVLIQDLNGCITFTDRKSLATTITQDGCILSNPVYNEKFDFPLDLSEDRQYVSYWSWHQTGTNSYEIWLSKWHLETNTTTRLTNLSKIPEINRITSIGSWNPASQSNLFFIASSVNQLDPLHYGNGGSITIFNMNDGKVLKTITGINPEITRWSPDGKMIFYLEKSDNPATTGRLSCYDLNTDKIEIIDHDKNYVDFFFK